MFTALRVGNVVQQVTSNLLNDELIVGFVNNACSFRDDYIPPGTFDLAYGLECVDLFPDIDSYCMLRIED